MRTIPAVLSTPIPYDLRAGMDPSLTGHTMTPWRGEPSGVGIYLKPGERKWLTITVEPGENEKVGDIYAFDIITTEESNDKVYGAARMYVVVTA